MNRSTTKLIIMALMIAVLASSGLAQQIIKIGVVNSQEVLEASAEGKRVLAQLQDKDKRNQAELTRRDAEIQDLQTRLNTQRLTLTPEALRNLTADLQRKQTERNRFYEDAGREMNELADRLFQRIQNELLPIIEQMGKENGLDIIFDLGKSGAIYFSPTVDITSDVILRYDASKVPTKK
ncbi:MAG: OmpH family outer membrane protein [Candidatus Aminicenantaceae bacterium]